MPPHVCAVANYVFPLSISFVFSSCLDLFCIIVSKFNFTSSNFPFGQSSSQGSPLLFTQIGILLFILTVGKLTIVSSSATHLHGNDKRTNNICSNENIELINIYALLNSEIKAVKSGLD